MTKEPLAHGRDLYDSRWRALCLLEIRKRQLRHFQIQYPSHFTKIKHEKDAAKLTSILGVNTFRYTLCLIFDTYNKLEITFTICSAR